MLTQTLADASALLENELLVDTVTLCTVSKPVTAGAHVTRPLTKLPGSHRALVQTTVLEGAIESQVSNSYSIKVERSSPLKAGMAVIVETCVMQPGLVGKTLLIDKISENGLALIIKAVASDFHQVNQQGKGDMS